MYDTRGQSVPSFSLSKRKSVLGETIERAYNPLPSAFSARNSVTPAQLSAFLTLFAVIAAVAWFAPENLMWIGYWVLWALFMGNALLRLWACSVPATPVTPPAISKDSALPTYTVVVALFREASIVPQLVNNLMRMDYPADRAEFIFALEEIDDETQAAFEQLSLPPNFRVIVVPEGYPRTKPRALNHALRLARGELAVVYDAEDQPHPLQMREAAQKFACSPANLACVQAPLRPQGVATFIGRQFSAEYAAHFDLFLPALFKAGISFPLGGTSNHFRTDVLRALGGWDEYNVTEDADMGLRITASGYQIGLLTLPTIETPPRDTYTWIPQRTRWIKGYMQTLLVYTRFNRPLCARTLLGLFLGVGLSLLCAFAVAPFTLMTAAYILLTVMQLAISPNQPLPIVAPQDLALFITGWTSALLSLWLGARRAGVKMKMHDMAGAPLYWLLHTVSAVYAFFQLIMKPHHWDKTEHSVVAEPIISATQTAKS